MHLQMPLMPNMPELLALAREHATRLPVGFHDWLAANPHVYDRFEREALAVAKKRQHYSARTIIEVLRHHSALKGNSDGWKLDNDMTPGLARLFALAHPAHKDLFEFRERRQAEEGVAA